MANANDTNANDDRARPESLGELIEWLEDAADNVPENSPGHDEVRNALALAYLLRRRGGALT